MHKIKKVLLVYKKSFFEVYHSKSALSKMKDKELLRRIKRSDDENRLTREVVMRVISSLGLKCDVLLRGEWDRDGRYDLVIAVGGDGTLFAASHYIKDTPVMAVNSDPANSLALFSCADRRNFAERFSEILSGWVKPTLINRMEVWINGKRMRELVMNDVLFTNKNPAAMSRYVLNVTARGGRRSEEQKGSGVWVSTAAGSTASILSAGGVVMPIETRELQYLVREPYNWNLPQYRMLRGFANRVEVLSRMSNAVVYIDGRSCYEVRFGYRVEMRMSRNPLHLYGYNSARRRFFIDKLR